MSDPQNPPPEPESFLDRGTPEDPRPLREQLDEIFGELKPLPEADESPSPSMADFGLPDGVPLPLGKPPML